MKLRYHFSLREVLLVTTIAALALGWWFDHRRFTAKIEAMTPLLQRASTISGRVVYADTGLPAVGVRVWAQANRGEVLGRRATEGLTMTDSDGRYQLVNLSPANWNIWAEANAWTVVAIDSLPVVAGQDVKDADLRLIKGGFIKGRVVDAATGKPMTWAGGMHIQIGVYGPMRPRSGPAVVGQPVDSKGEFRIQVPPGKSYPYIMSVHPGKVSGARKYSEEGVDVEDGKETVIEFSLGGPPAQMP
jgi:hypothetical protein